MEVGAIICAASIYTASINRSALSSRISKTTTHNSRKALASLVAYLSLA